MQAIILAGGMGTRLSPITKEIPKPMVKVLNRPLMEYNIELLKRHGITKIGVTLLYLPQYIKEYFGDGSAFEAEISYFEEDIPLGTAGCCKLAEKYIDDNIVILSGDALTNIDISKVLIYHNSVNADVTIVLSKQNNPLDYGVVMLDDSGKVVSFVEKPLWENVTANTVNTGIYVLNRRVFDEIPDNIEYDFSKDLFPKLLNDGFAVYGYVSDDYWCDMGTPESYLQGHRDILSGKAFGNAYGNTVERGVTVAESVKLNAPVFIGKNAVIAGNSVIGPYATIGEGCIINNSQVINSVIWEHSTVENCQAHDLIACNNTAVSGCVLDGFNTIGAYATVNKNVHLLRKATVSSFAFVPKNTTVENNYSEASASVCDAFQNGKLVGVWNNSLTPKMLLGLASSLKKEKLLVAYNEAALPIARLFASFSVLCGTNVYFAKCNESSGRFHSSIYEIDGIYFKASSEGLSVDVWDNKGRNIPREREKKLSLSSNEMQPNFGNLIKMTGLDSDFEYYLNGAFPFSSTNIVLKGADKYKLHNVLFDKNSGSCYAVITSSNGGISQVEINGKRLALLDFLMLKVEISAFLGAKKIYLPPYASSEVIKKAEELKLEVIFSEQHKGNSMQKAESFNSIECLSEYEPAFFALALSYYAQWHNNISSSDKIIARYDFVCPDGKMCDTIFALNKNRDGNRITANYKNGFITVIPKNDGFSFTAYGKFAKEEYAPDMLADFVNEALTAVKR